MKITPLLLPLMLAIALPAHAQMTDAAPKMEKAERTEAAPFATPDLMVPAALLPAPPAPETPQGQAELAMVRAAALHATPERRAKADKDGQTENVTFFADTIPGFDVAKLPATKKLFDDIATEEDVTTKSYKSYFARKRPYQVDPTIQTCGGEKHNTKANSYPSGHTTLGFAMGVILADLIPEKAQDILNRAKIYAENRVICGVHYPYDTVAGQSLGTALAIEMLQDANFREELAAARKELIAAGLTH